MREIPRVAFHIILSTYFSFNCSYLNLIEFNKIYYIVSRFCKPTKTETIWLHVPCSSDQILLGSLYYLTRRSRRLGGLKCRPHNAEVARTRIDDLSGNRSCKE